MKILIKYSKKEALYIEKEYVKSCIQQGIETKVIMEAEILPGWTIQWMRADDVNWTFFIKQLNQSGVLEVYFFKEIDRAVFIYELAKKMNFDIRGVLNCTDYYGLEKVYSLELVK